MWYYGKVIRDGCTLFLVSPRWNEYTLSADKKGLYLFSSEQSARAALTPHVLPTDTVAIVRTYRG